MDGWRSYVPLRLRIDRLGGAHSFMEFVDAYRPSEVLCSYVAKQS